MYEVIYSPGAWEEYEKSILWYAARSVKAANNFVEEIEARLTAIAQQPWQFKRNYKHYYEAHLNTYPFTLVFAVEERVHQIIIITFHHQKRNPKRIYRKRK